MFRHTHAASETTRPTGGGGSVIGKVIGLLAIVMLIKALTAARRHGMHTMHGRHGGPEGRAWGWRMDRLAELHRELHRRDADASGEQEVTA